MQTRQKEGGERERERKERERERERERESMVKRFCLNLIVLRIFFLQITRLSAINVKQFIKPHFVYNVR